MEGCGIIVDELLQDLAPGTLCPVWERYGAARSAFIVFER